MSTIGWFLVWETFTLPAVPIDTVSNIVFWSRFVNKLEPWHIVYVMQQ